MLTRHELCIKQFGTGCEVNHFDLIFIRDGIKEGPFCEDFDVVVIRTMSSNNSITLIEQFN